ncbi:MAG: transglycosylase SLT domain-containing protein [Xenococcaceae cyanobacterium MO_188.B32]|nr:transglycosylase SLT domain-containing protein [Xenococcaceae cyanobacterium MO_188.B32]
MSNKLFLTVILGGASTTLITTIGLIIKSQRSAIESHHTVVESKVSKKHHFFPFTKALASAEDSHLNNHRHSYLLASNLIEQQQGKRALKQLENLEQDYLLLAPYILLKQGQAYELEGNIAKATEVWQNLIIKYPDSPAIVEALYLLGRDNPAYWDRAITQFPHHPRTHDIIRRMLAQNPNQPRLMLVLVKNTPEAKDVEQIRERLVKEYSSQLSAADWEAIADGYWLKWDYGKAGQAYTKAPRTPRNLYRAARGLHLGNDKTKAKQYYLQLLRAFPKAEETGLGLRRLATIVNKREALNYLDLVISRFPQETPQALVQKAKILESLKSPVSAANARQVLLTNYASSEAAAQYRWRMAQKKAQAKDFMGAWQWAQPIAVNNPDSSLAPKAGFWVGKWAQQLGHTEETQTAFKSVLTSYPQSYYAWRSAVALGWDVGDFTTVRQKLPLISSANTRFLPPAGSAIFQELYKLGLEEEAWTQFRVEVSKKQNLTVAEEFTWGLMQLHQGKNLRSINQIWSLKKRDNPEDREQWQALRQTSQYWQALFPMPFEESILKWSQQRQINPLLVTSLIRQESRFEPEIKSSAGALGLMQVMPGTGQWIAQQTKQPNYSLTNPEDNINFGTFYLDYTHRRYNNNSMLAVASYNAGPNNVAKWVSRYGLSDPDFFVEQIPFRETRGYVESVFENYWNYMLIYNPDTAKLFEQLS